MTTPPKPLRWSVEGMTLSRNGKLDFVITAPDGNTWYAHVAQAGDWGIYDITDRNPRNKERAAIMGAIAHYVLHGAFGIGGL